MTHTLSQEALDRYGDVTGLLAGTLFRDQVVQDS